MKNLFLAILLSFSATGLLAQSNFDKIGIGVNAGVTYGFGDATPGKFAPSFGIVGDYFINPFITAGLDLQVGKISGGGFERDPHTREYENSYMSYALNGKVRLGMLTDFYYNDFLNLTKGFYLGTGFGIIQNNMTKITRVSYNGYTFPGEDKSTNLVVPINMGIDFFFFNQWGDPKYVVNVNLQQSFVFGEGMDGYNDPPPFKNLAPDTYTFITVGFKYTFGPQGLANKTYR